MGKVFISYRREDAAGYARAIYEELTERFTADRIFMDVDAIEPGLPFDEVIRNAVGQCEALLVLIGARWLAPQPDGKTRLEDERDFVRLEIAAALARNIRVIPVLLDGTPMPKEAELPEALRGLVWRNAIEVSNTRFPSDVDRLAQVLVWSMMWLRLSNCWLRHASGCWRMTRPLSLGMSKVFAFPVVAHWTRVWPRPLWWATPCCRPKPFTTCQRRCAFRAVSTKAASCRSTKACVSRASTWPRCRAARWLAA